MKVVLRADASLQMGTGHVMRCLTLADALVAQGTDCQFVCREHPGDLIAFIRSKGHVVHVLDAAAANPGMSEVNPAPGEPAHSHWLGATQAQDASACAAILARLQPEWLIVDHYALDARWELALQPHYRKLLVIDDLADRAHACDLLLDQTYGRDSENYRARVPASCRLLCGAQYALLRPEFAALRPYSLQRRAKPQLRELLISMGGVDKDNATGRVLQVLRGCPLPADCQITVVMGATAPWLLEVTSQAQSMRWPTRVLAGVNDMAQLMADSDLAIGAAGATSWERCCLGLPTIMVVLAENQKLIAESLARAGAVRLLRGVEWIASDLPPLLDELVADSSQCVAMSRRGADIVDGQGVATVIHHLER